MCLRERGGSKGGRRHGEKAETRNEGSQEVIGGQASERNG